MAIFEWSSVSVLIFLGLATLSTGEHAFMQDKLRALRRLPTYIHTSCHLRCAKDSNKAISEKECIRSCQGKLTPSLEQGKSHDFSKRMIDRHFIRRQRSVDMNVLNECQFSKQVLLHKAKILLVNLTGEGWLHIIWDAIDSSETDFNWTSYGLIYHDYSIEGPNCVKVPKNQTDYLLKQVGDWKLPYSFHTAVVVNPYRNGEIELQSFTIGGHPRTFQIPTVSSKDTVTLISSIVGGLIAALVLLVILYCAVKWRRKTLSPDRPPMPPHPTHKENTKERYYSCYYPESEEFRERVASIVNYFRHNGYNVIMDRMVSEEITSQGPARWGENQIRKAKKVLIFLSPGLVNLAMDSQDDSQCQDVNRVWIELEVLRDIYTKNRSAAQMVCIALPDVPVTFEVLPLWAEVSYKWPDDALEILKRLNDRPMILPV
ncbi:uncharacterized protein LOC110044516 [Orbicella faveolata]|uniref:uncharacterized protein LOC110044516 n=1 Tax=Orbicella faveolata TaxID=48498 RepID=UPI0009E53FE9|nr:uncharacterized protein LOC110044516 [Orbicella faveolata]